MSDAQVPWWWKKFVQPVLDWVAVSRVRKIAAGVAVAVLAITGAAAYETYRHHSVKDEERARLEAKAEFDAASRSSTPISAPGLTPQTSRPPSDRA